MTLPALLTHSIRYRRQCEPRVVIIIDVRAPDGRDAVWLDIPNAVPVAANHGSAA